MELVTIADAQKILQCSKPTIYKMIHNGKLVAYKKPTDRKTYLDRAQVDALAGALGPAAVATKTKKAKRG